MEENSDGDSFQITDRRSWLEDEDLLERTPPPEKRYPSFVEELKARTELAERKLQERIEDLEAENEAFRARLDKDMERRLEQQKMDLLRGFLEVIDNFERALQAFEQTSSLEELKKGIQLTWSSFSRSSRPQESSQSMSSNSPLILTIRKRSESSLWKTPSWIITW